MSTTTSLFTSPAAYSVDPGLGHRRATAAVTVRGADGAPLPDADVVVEQTGHAFLFGNIGFDLVEHANALASGEAGSAYGQAFAERWFDLFNMATMPFYWGTFEPSEGQPRADALMTASRWFQDQGVVVKGHPLVWHTVQPKWLLGKPLEHVAVGREIVIVGDEDVAARPCVQRRPRQLVQVDRDGIAHDDLPCGGTDEVVAQHVTGLPGQLDPLVPGPNQADPPVLVDDLGDPRLGPHRQLTEGVAVQVDQLPVLPHEPVTERRELVGSVQGLRI